MGVLVKVGPDLQFKPVWLTGELDFPVDMTHGHLVQTSTGVRGGSARQFEYELKWGCERFKAWMEREGKVYMPIPPELAKAAEARGKAVMHGFIIDGPFLPMKFAASKEEWLRGGGDDDVLPRKREMSLRDTGGKVCYRMAGLFLVKEQVVNRIVERDKEPALWERIKDAKKTNGLFDITKVGN